MSTNSVTEIHSAVLDIDAPISVHQQQVLSVMDAYEQCMLVCDQWLGVHRLVAIRLVKLLTSWSNNQPHSVRWGLRRRHSTNRPTNYDASNYQIVLVVDNANAATHIVRKFDSWLNAKYLRKKLAIVRDRDAQGSDPFSRNTNASMRLVHVHTKSFVDIVAVPLVSALRYANSSNAVMLLCGFDVLVNDTLMKWFLKDLVKRMVDIFIVVTLRTPVESQWANTHFPSKFCDTEFPAFLSEKAGDGLNVESACRFEVCALTNDYLDLWHQCANVLTSQHRPVEVSTQRTNDPPEVLLSKLPQAEPMPEIAMSPRMADSLRNAPKYTTLLTKPGEVAASSDEETQHATEPVQKQTEARRGRPRSSSFSEDRPTPQAKPGRAATLHRSKSTHRRDAIPRPTARAPVAPRKGKNHASKLSCSRSGTSLPAVTREMKF